MRQGVSGQTLRLVREDDEYKPESTVRLVRMVAQRDKPVAFLNLLGSANVGALLKDGTFDEIRVPAVGVTPGADALRRPGSGWMFHVQASDSAQIKRIINQRNASDQFFEWTPQEAITDAAAPTVMLRQGDMQGQPLGAEPEKPPVKRRPKFVVDAVDLLGGDASEGKVSLGALSSYLKRMDPAFSPQSYGHAGLLNMIKTYDLLHLHQEESLAARSGKTGPLWRKGREGLVLRTHYRNIQSDSFKGRR